MRRIHPSPTVEMSIDDAYAASLGRSTSRPWVALAMVTSLDGSTVVDGRSGGLANTNDSRVLQRLRSIADVIVVGAGTVRAEGYGPPSKDGQRIGVVTSSGRVDLTSELFRTGSGFVITSEEAAINGADGVDVVRAGRERVDLDLALRSLGEVCENASVVQAEGGSTLNGAFVDADLVDEINVTTAPLVVGGTGPRLASGGGDRSFRYGLEQLLLDEDGYAFARWRRLRDR